MKVSAKQTQSISKNLVVLILVMFLGGMIAGVASAADPNKADLLMDGFLLTGVDGKLTGTDSNNIWLFEFDSDVSDATGRVCAGTSLELLPSAALEKITADAKTHSDTSYQLWGKVTRYNSRNFIFPIYFLPFGKIKQSQSPTAENLSDDSQESQQRETPPVINEPDDALPIPEEIIAKLESRRIIHPQQLRKGLELKQDFILADRTGFISSRVMRDASSDKSKKEKVGSQNTQYYFVLDALGQGVEQICFQLLPCQALEQAQRKQSAEPDNLRFKVAGIVTKYKGKHYLLLQRATPVYSYGNFGR